MSEPQPPDHRAGAATIAAFGVFIAGIGGLVFWLDVRHASPESILMSLLFCGIGTALIVLGVLWYCRGD